MDFKVTRAFRENKNYTDKLINLGVINKIEFA